MTFVATDKQTAVRHCPGCANGVHMQKPCYAACWTYHHTDEHEVSDMTDLNAVATVISAAELVAKGDRQGELLLLTTSEVPAKDLRAAALEVFSGLLAGTPLEQLRADVHRVALQDGAGDRQVVLNLETVALLQATRQGDVQSVQALVDGSEFVALDHAHAIVTLAGQAVAGWVGPGGVPGVFAALRRDWAAR